MSLSIFSYYIAVSLLSNTTLRLAKPQCGLNPCWTEEPIKSQVTRAVSQLHERTVPAKRRGKAVIDSSAEAFPGPTFAYCFYLLKGVLKGKSLHYYCVPTCFQSSKKGLPTPWLVLILNASLINVGNNIITEFNFANNNTNICLLSDSERA